MAKCRVCNQEMTAAQGCVMLPITIKGRAYRPIPNDEDKPCHDCGAQPGQYHHPGCDMEKCPRCRMQILSCGCLYEPEEVGNA